MSALFEQFLAGEDGISALLRALPAYAPQRGWMRGLCRQHRWRMRQPQQEPQQKHRKRKPGRHQ